ncbi:MAG: DUF1501 domain-containing protein, partial [Pirellula sp.]
MTRASQRRSFLKFASVSPWCAAGVNGGASHAKADPTDHRSAFGTAKSCVLLWLDGGPSHLETFDPKIDVPREVQGPLGS